MTVAELIEELKKFPEDMEVAALNESELIVTGNVVGVSAPESLGLIVVCFQPEEE